MEMIGLWCRLSLIAVQVWYSSACFNAALCITSQTRPLSVHGQEFIAELNKALQGILIANEDSLEFWMKGQVDTKLIGTDTIYTSLGCVVNSDVRIVHNLTRDYINFVVNHWTVPYKRGRDRSQPIWTCIGEIHQVEVHCGRQEDNSDAYHLVYKVVINSWIRPLFVALRKSYLMGDMSVRLDSDRLTSPCWMRVFASSRLSCKRCGDFEKT